jgi:vacuolar-type H+-ATPase subunit H
MLGEAVGSGNSFESKYRYRTAQRICPECGQATIIAGNPEFNDGVANFICWKKKGGCGLKFEAGDKRITSQPVGRMPNPDVSDQVNTIQKMAQKRALVAAVLVVTNCSDTFTQDLEDENPVDTAVREVKREAKQAAKEAKQQWPEEIAQLLERIPSGGIDKAMNYVHEELVKIADQEGEAIYAEERNALAQRIKRKASSAEDMQNTVLRLWAHVVRLRMPKGEES